MSGYPTESIYSKHIELLLSAELPKIYLVVQLSSNHTVTLA